MFLLAFCFQRALQLIVVAYIGNNILDFSLQGLKFVEYNSIFADGDEKNEAQSLKISLKLNDAACQLKLNNFPAVVELATKVYN